MRIAYIVVLLWSCFSAERIAAGGELSKEEVAVRDYSYKGVRIGTTVEEFLRLFPVAKRQSSGDARVTALYAPLGKDQRFILVECFRGRVYYIGVTFSPAMLATLGGREVLETKITDTLGYPNSVKGNMSHWEFPNVNRKVGYQQSADGGAMLLILDTAVDRHRREAKVEDLDIGF